MFTDSLLQIPGNLGRLRTLQSESECDTGTAIGDSTLSLAGGMVQELLVPPMTDRTEGESECGAGNTIGDSSPFMVQEPMIDVACIGSTTYKEGYSRPSPQPFIFADDYYGTIPLEPETGTPRQLVRKSTFPTLINIGRLL